MESELEFVRRDCVSRPVLSSPQLQELQELLENTEGYYPGIPITDLLPESKSFWAEVWYKLLAPDLHGIYLGPKYPIAVVADLKLPRLFCYSPENKWEVPTSGDPREVWIYLPLFPSEGGHLYLPDKRYSTRVLPAGYALSFPASEAHGISRLRGSHQFALVWIVKLFDWE